MIYKKTPKADEDILGIYAYTLEHFGEEQAITYFRSLEGCFEFLCDHPRAARQRDEFTPPVRIHHHNNRISDRSRMAETSDQRRLGLRERDPTVWEGDVQTRQRQDEQFRASRRLHSNLHTNYDIL